MPDSKPLTIDLMHLGFPGAMSAHLIDGVIVDPGCEKTVDKVIEALDGEAPEAILLTHIHFDHAGGTGRLVEKYPDVEVWVHEKGAHHMVDPTRLVGSARQVFGEYFDMLWGEVVPVPEKNIRVLKGGESEGPWEVAYTPGHAKHHVSYLHTPTSTAFTGDVTGVRINSGPAFAPTPPPDINPPLWHESLDIVSEWDPDRLAFMHFGQIQGDAQHQIQMVHDALDEFYEVSKTTDAEGMTEWIRAWVIDRAGEDEVDGYFRASPFNGMWSGYNHYTQQLEKQA